MPAFALRSPAFEDGMPIPRRHTCEGEDVSPALEWTVPPAEARSLALVIEDPDAPGGTFTHWLAWGIEPGARGLAEGERPPLEGRNDFRRHGWRGPCPPRGHGPHRYVFRLVALDTTLDDLASGAAARDLDEAVSGHALAAAELIGTFERDRQDLIGAVLVPEDQCLLIPGQPWIVLPGLPEPVVAARLDLAHRNRAHHRSDPLSSWSSHRAVVRWIASATKRGRGCFE